jgi:uncharacterized protein YodC (DUF2158 family)
MEAEMAHCFELNLDDHDYQLARRLNRPDIDLNVMLKRDMNTVKEMLAFSGNPKTAVSEYVGDRLLVYCHWFQKHGYHLQEGSKFGCTVNLETGEIVMHKEIQDQFSCETKKKKPTTLA